MKSPYQNVRPPYALRSNVVYFHDWRYVNPGSPAWRGPGGEAVALMATGAIPEPMRYTHVDAPTGIRLEAMPAQKSDCVLHARDTGDAGIASASMIKEDGVYRIWCETWLPEQFADGSAGNSNALRYLESTDGVNWRVPRNLPAPKKSRGARASNAVMRRDRNVVYGAHHTPKHGYHGGCVFIDPSAPKSERYKSFHLGLIDRAGMAAYRRKRPHDNDPFADVSLKSREQTHSLFGAVSPDGIRWRALPEMLLALFSDTANICEYDPVLERYVGYVRTWLFHRRGIGRVFSDNFRRFTPPEEVIWPDATQAPCDTWYANGKTIVPGTDDYHVMFPMRWMLPTDQFDVHLATSPDNLTWGHVPGGAVIRPAEDPAAWDAGVVAPMKGMVEWGADRRWSILYGGFPVPHKYPRRPPFGGMAWASWARGRLVALRCPVDGGFTLWPLTFTGNGVHLNVRTARSGSVRVEALVDGKVLAGRSFNDCDPITGDHFDRVVTWRGQSHLGHGKGQAVELRFRLRNADLFAVEFR